MEEIIEKNFDKAFAIAWSENQGSYSEDIAKKTLNFLKLQGLKVNTVLDVCCGSANFLSIMSSHGKECTGTEILDSYIEYDKSKYPNITFHKTEEILDFDHLGTFDLITCNHDVVNMLPTIEEWGEFFKRAYRHLNNGGLLIFDYYTKRKLKDWNEVTYDENDKLDYVRNVVSDSNSTSISNIYYININQDNSVQEISAVDREYSLNNYNNKYKKTEDTTVEYFFENDEVLEQIKHAGYRYLITTDANFAPVSGLSDMNRLHVIAIKREVGNVQRPTAPTQPVANPQPAPVQQNPVQPTVENVQPVQQPVSVEAPVAPQPAPVQTAPVQAVEPTPAPQPVVAETPVQPTPVPAQPVTAQSNEIPTPSHSVGVDVEPQIARPVVAETAPSSYEQPIQSQGSSLNVEDVFNEDLAINTSASVISEDDMNGDSVY